MDQEFKTKWVAALRSGNHTQHRRLANDSFGRGPLDPRPVGTEVTARCCLNVGAYAVLGDRADEMGTLPCFELLVGSPSYQPAIFSKLILMNDIENASFAEIADWIETNL